VHITAPPRRDRGWGAQPPRRIDRSARKRAADRRRPRRRSRIANFRPQVNVPKAKKAYCKGKECKKHTMHKVTQYKTGKASLYAQGASPPPPLPAGAHAAPPPARPRGCRLKLRLLRLQRPRDAHTPSHSVPPP